MGLIPASFECLGHIYDRYHPYRNLPSTNDELPVESSYIRARINEDRYYVTHSRRHAVVTCRLKNHLRNLPSIAAARSELSNYPSARYLASRISFTVGYYTFQQAIERVAQWMVWHSHWVFGTQVEEVLPHNYPLRRNIPKLGAEANEEQPEELRTAQHWAEEPDSDVVPERKDDSSDSSSDISSTSETSLGDFACD